jgi:predicted acylesterase/phospholipase RssA
VPFAAVATHLATGELVVLRDRPLVPALIAAAAPFTR